MSDEIFPTLEGYEFISKLGSGSMGAVYRALEVTSGKQVAIKTVLVQDESQRTALKNEWAVLQRVEHPYLINETAFFEVGPSLFMVMELFESVTLGRWIEANPREQRERQGLIFAKHLSELLTYLHSQSPPVIVRDLKPDNILVNQNSQIKLIDFGISRTLEHDSKTHLDLKGFASQSYAPLEQYTAQATTTEKSDVYALGATLYHVLIGSPPPSAIELLSNGIDPKTELTRQGFSNKLASLVASAMALKADQRIDLDQFAHKLSLLNEPEPTQAVPPEAARPVQAKSAPSVFENIRSTLVETKVEIGTVKQLMAMVLFLIGFALLLDFAVTAAGL